MTYSQVAVLCVTYNNADTIRGLLESLCAQQGAVERVVIVDNDSNDGTVGVVTELERQLELRVLLERGENVGFAAGMAAASAAVSGTGLPILAINPDVVLSPGTVPDMLALLRDEPSVGVVTAPLQLLDGSPDPASRRKLPRLLGSALYALLGRLAPASLRYNAPGAATEQLMSHSGLRYTVVEATTGALMLFNPAFRAAGEPPFDTDYWMYGEDLQVCADVRARGMSVGMVERAASTHIKGVSSGFPRSSRADREFHRAMWTYYVKNLRSNPAEAAVVGTGIGLRWVVSRVAARLYRLRKRS